MKIFHSIRWRLQLWHGLILVAVLVGIGWPGWHFQRTNQLERIDLELKQRIGLLVEVLGPRNGPRRPPPGRGGPPPSDRRGPPPSDHQDPPPFGGMRPFDVSLLEINFQEREAALFKGSAKSDFYFIVWDPDGAPLARSESAPEVVPAPGFAGERSVFRRRGNYRECARFDPKGGSILVGRDIAPDLTDLRRFGWMMIGSALVVLSLGLVGGWWLSSRALRPVAEISSTARRISGGDLSQRIQSADTDSEIGELVGVLNSTFIRLQANFLRQAQFTADAAHELRTPVTVLLTQTQGALARERSAEEYRECVEACQRAGKRMRELTESLLVLARLDSEEEGAAREVVDLAGVVRDTEAQWMQVAEQKGLHLEMESAPIKVRGCPHRLSQIVDNLLSNALDYNRPGGWVKVKVGPQGADAVLVVADGGQGVDPKDAPHVFERFYRADESRTAPQGHTGLGLAIVEGIVKAHGGSITLESELGKGSVFTVRLPAQGGA